MVIWDFLVSFKFFGVVSIIGYGLSSFYCGFSDVNMFHRIIFAILLRFFCLFVIQRHIPHTTFRATSHTTPLYTVCHSTHSTLNHYSIPFHKQTLHRTVSDYTITLNSQKTHHRLPYSCCSIKSMNPCDYNSTENMNEKGCYDYVKNHLYYWMQILITAHLITAFFEVGDILEKGEIMNKDESFGG